MLFNFAQFKFVYSFYPISTSPQRFSLLSKIVILWYWMGEGFMLSNFFQFDTFSLILSHLERETPPPRCSFSLSFSLSQKHKYREEWDLGKERLLLEDCQNAEGLLEHGDAGLEVHPEVDHLPVDPLLQVLLLLQHKPEPWQKISKFEPTLLWELEQLLLLDKGNRWAFSIFFLFMRFDKCII